MNKIRWQKYIKIHYDDKNVVYFTTIDTIEHISFLPQGAQREEHKEHYVFFTTIDTIEHISIFTTRNKKNTIVSDFNLLVYGC